MKFEQIFSLRKKKPENLKINSIEKKTNNFDIFNDVDSIVHSVDFNSIDSISKSIDTLKTLNEKQNIFFVKEYLDEKISTLESIMGIMSQYFDAVNGLSGNKKIPDNLMPLIEDMIFDKKTKPHFLAHGVVGYVENDKLFISRDRENAVNFVNFLKKQKESFSKLIELNKNSERIDDSISRSKDFSENSFTIDKTKYDLIKNNDLCLKDEDKNIINTYIRFFKTNTFDCLEHEFNFKRYELSLTEQGYFLSFLESAKNEEIEKAKRFGSVFGKDGFKTFLSLAHGGEEMGDKILTLGEKLPKESAEKLFAKYGEIVDEVDNIAEYLSKSLGEKASPEIVEEAKNNLLIKGKDLLARYAKDADVCRDQECADLGVELEEKLKDIKSSLLLLGSATKVLVEQGQFDFKDFQDIEISYDTKALDDKDKASIYAMSAVNTQQYPEKLREYWSGTLQKGLENPTQGETVINVKYKGEIISAMRVIPQSDGSFYGGSFNVNPNLQGSRIGTELLRQVIEEYTKKGDFNADCYEKNPMLDVYTGKFGFKIVGEVENYHDTGSKIFNIKKEKTV